MLLSYVKTAFRFLLKNKTFSFVNIIGLSAGTLCCLYILLYVQQQYSYDKHHQQAADIYRITTSLTLSGDHSDMGTSSPPVAPTLKHDFPEVQQFTRVFNATIFGAGQHLLTYKDRSFFEQKAWFVDSTFFDVFNYHFIAGNPTNALTEPYSVVLLQSAAEKLFGKEDPIGKFIGINNKAGKENLKVTGVVDESLGHSHIGGNLFITMRSGLIGRIVQSNDSWAGSNYLYSYVKLKPGTSMASFEKKLAPLLLQYGGKQMKDIGMEKQLHLQRIADIHTDTRFKIELSQSVNSSLLYILLSIAILIQVIACINFMNLSTARASKRAKEVGVRKVIGAGRGNLVRQFLGESFLLTLLSVLLAIPLLLFTLPYLNNITGANIELSLFSNHLVWLTLAVLAVATGLLAGSYPAFYLSAFQAIKVIKGNFTNHLSAVGLRRSLVVFQFVLSTLLITGVGIIYYQLSYIKNKDLGYSREQKVVFSVYTDGVNIAGLLDDFRLMPEVKSATRSSMQLGRAIFSDRNFYQAGQDAAHSQNAQLMVSDRYFVQAASIRMAGGRDFREGDSGRVLINETFARAIHLDPKASEGVKLFSQDDKGKETSYEIAGVMKDFHYNSLHEELKPFILICNPKSPSLCDMTVACNTDNYKALLGKMEAIWHKRAPGIPFEFTFLDDIVQHQYEAEIVLSRIINAFTVMAILISCLGLFGLAAFSAEQRSKEIGIRKVLGASVTGIVRLLNREFLKLVGIAVLIAIPASWWLMNQWLAGFAYRVDVQWWMFALACLPAVGIALFTVSFQALRAALSNPIKALRSE